MLGGMGPAATVDFMAKLVAGTPAVRDQEHIPMIVVNDPRVPDRTRAIQAGDEWPVLDALRDGVRRLEAAGADAIAMPCNTAHHWLERLEASTALPFLSIIDATMVALRSTAPAASAVAVLGTEGTLATGLYQRRLAAEGYAQVRLSEAHIAAISGAIASVKSADRRAAAEALAPVLEELAALGTHTALLACTELPLAAKAMESGSSLRLVDSTRSLVEYCLAWAYAR